VKAWMFWSGAALAFGSWLSYKVLWPVLMSRRWQHIPARIEDVTVSEWDGIPIRYNPSGATYNVSLNYSYEVNGEFYSGCYSPPALSEADVLNYRQAYPKGRNIVIRCNLSKPEDSVFVEREQES
jgi:hypothetical protein